MKTEIRKNPKLSIALFTYNNANTIEKAMEGIFHQQHEYSFEVIVSDRGSQDETLKKIQKFKNKYPDVVHILDVDDQDTFPSKHYIQTLRFCHGTYVCTLDGRDYWTDKHKLTKQISFLESHSDYVLSCHRFHIHYEDLNKTSNDFLQIELFKNKPEGFEFDQKNYFIHWFAQSSTVVFKAEALLNTPHLDTNLYCWDTQTVWTILSKGKGFVHNFFGGVCHVAKKEAWKKSDEINQSVISYQIIDELLASYPEDKNLKSRLDFYHQNLNTEIKENRNLLDLRQIKNKNFTIVSDDPWGGEVYKAFAIEENSPFISTYISNKDFIELVTHFEKYITQSLRFIPFEDKKKTPPYCFNRNKPYPVALLGDKIEIQFIGYTSEKEALELWKTRCQRINFDNIFFKMDASYESDNAHYISQFLDHPHPQKACFLNAFQKKKMSKLSSTKKDFICLIEVWLPNPNLLYPYSLKSFNVIRWLNQENVSTIKAPSFSTDIFRFPREKHDHYLTEFNKKNAVTVNADYFPKSYQIKFDEEEGHLQVTYNKHDLEYFYIGAEESLHNWILELSLDFTNPESRHILILAKGNPEHTLRAEFVALDRYDKDMRIQVDGFDQEIPEDFEWMHFDLSGIVDSNMNMLFSKVKGICFYVNPKENAHGKLEILAVYAGALATFEKCLS